MSEEATGNDSHSEDTETSESSSQNVSKVMLWVGIAIMLLPAGIPLYFAVVADGSDAIWFYALAGAVAVINTLLVVALWRWLNSLSAEPQ